VTRTRFYNFKTSLFEPYQKNAFFLDELITAMYASGCSKRDISRILENLYGIKYSPQALSRITNAAEKKIEEERPKTHNEVVSHIICRCLFCESEEREL